jgi:hypothetical protein
MLKCYNIFFFVCVYVCMRLATDWNTRFHRWFVSFEKNIISHSQKFLSSCIIQKYLVCLCYCASTLLLDILNRNTQCSLEREKNISEAWEKTGKKRDKNRLIGILMLWSIQQFSSDSILSVSETLFIYSSCAISRLIGNCWGKKRKRFFFSFIAERKNSEFLNISISLKKRKKEKNL